MKQWMPVIGCCLLTLGGCASQNQPRHTTEVASPAAESAWRQRQADFARMSAWRLQGKVGVQFKEQSASFNMSWLQNGNDGYEMNIKNPLTGSIVAYLKGNASEVTLQTNGKTYKDASAERLLQGQLGVSLPLDGMKYWVRGVPEPDAPVQQVKLDAQGRPEVLQQSGWLVEYNGWQGNDWKALPEKINLSRAPDNTKVKVIAKDWRTRY
ncbi:lipoprotein insertase outer membrane protein LolB [Candidatus Thiothrix sp. Deng01]|uniref:Outer-membrane lipoprotein LolB n=1 Tax=Candidatus Thiothrix phosphatis TaxID=3112415 RepID=A0ABU6CZX7_9GAMM|nr:lipoprotein insertase outer membrane protein LolB [Candidatus Thiothrix sp. Deng01]MEB4592390.1 lipoprotein insertase outer membrane protein LolB [Candidatus Thiothrix sp. Deng01]